MGGRLVRPLPALSSRRVLVEGGSTLASLVLGHCLPLLGEAHLCLPTHHGFALTHVNSGGTAFSPQHTRGGRCLGSGCARMKGAHTAPPTGSGPPVTHCAVSVTQMLLASDGSRSQLMGGKPGLKIRSRVIRAQGYGVSELGGVPGAVSAPTRHS